MAAEGNKDRMMASHLVKAGYPHGRRFGSPAPDSGGMTMTKTAGSTNYKRLRGHKDEVA